MPCCCYSMTIPHVYSHVFKILKFVIQTPDGVACWCVMLVKWPVQPYQGHQQAANLKLWNVLWLPEVSCLGSRGATSTSNVHICNVRSPDGGYGPHHHSRTGSLQMLLAEVLTIVLAQLHCASLHKCQSSHTKTRASTDKGT